MITQNDLNDKIPIHRGCKAPNGCFCTGKCKEIIGYLVNGKIEYLPKQDDQLKEHSREYLLKNKPDGTY
jgi:hypothetical protein